MTFNDFIARKPLTPADLFGEWKQKGTEDFSDPKAGVLAAEKLSWMRIRVKRAIKAKELTIPATAECAFKRGKIPQAKVGEVMTVRNGSDLLYTVIAGGGEFVVNRGTSPVAKAEKKNGRKGKLGKSEKESRTPAEIQAATPIELRTGWTNYDLQDEINAEVADKSVKYWDAHDGKFPKRKMRKRA